MLAYILEARISVLDTFEIENLVPQICRAIIYGSKASCIQILEYCTYTCMHTRVNMHILKVETLVTSSTESLES